MRKWTCAAQVPSAIAADKNGISPDRIIFGPGIFFGPISTPQARGLEQGAGTAPCIGLAFGRGTGLVNMVSNKINDILLKALSGGCWLIKRYLNLCLVLFIFVFLSKTVLAGGSSNSSKSMRLEELIVSGNNLPEDFRTGDVDKHSSPSFFSVIERDRFEGKITSLGEIVEKEVGVQVRRHGGLGSLSSVSLRGSDSDQVMVYLDGVLLNKATGGGVNLSDISLGDVQAIEVYRGTVPGQFGKASMGGVVNIQTRRGDKGFKGDIGLGYGSFHTKQGSFFINHKPGKWDYLFSFDTMDTANDFEFENDQGTPWNPNDDKKEERNNAAVTRHNLLAKAGYDFSSDLRVELNNQWFYKDQELPGPHNSERADTTLDTRRNITTLRLIADDWGGQGMNSHFKASHSWKEENYDDSEGFVGLGRQKNIYTTESSSGSVYLECMKGNHLLSLNTKYKYEQYEVESLLQDQNPNDSSRDLLSVTLQDSWFLFGDRLIFTPALRYNYIRDELESGKSIYGQHLEGRSRDKNYFEPQAGLKYRATDWLNLKANWSDYVREPSFFELFGDRGLFHGNPDLMAEKGMNFDGGAEVDYRMRNSLIQRINVQAAYFYREVDNLITRVYDARGVGKSLNIAGSRIEGLETNLSLDFLDHLRLIGRATWKDTENQGEDSAYKGNQLPGRYKKSYLGRLEFKIKYCKFYAERILDKDMYYDSANLLKAEDKDEINLGLNASYNDFILTLEAKNIQDNQYEDFNGYPLPGRSYSANLKYSF